MKVNIIGTDYDVQEAPCVSKQDLLLGEIDFIHQIIKLDESLAVDAKRITLLHEIIHGIMFACGMETDNENLTQSIASGLYQALKNNDELLEYLGFLGRNEP